jgi:hypothetical protein
MAWTGSILRILPGFRRIAVVGVAVAILGVGAGGTLAASVPTTLYACYDAYGNVRISDLNTCKLPAGGRLVPISTAGAAGPTGPTGPAGATGPGGVTSTYRVQNDYSLAGVQQIVGADCLAGDLVLGGGIWVSPDAYSRVTLIASSPTGGPNSTSWWSIVNVTAGPEVTVSAMALCADATP